MVAIPHIANSIHYQLGRSPHNTAICSATTTATITHSVHRPGIKHTNASTAYLNRPNSNSDDDGFSYSQPTDEYGDTDSHNYNKRDSHPDLTYQYTTLYRCQYCCVATGTITN
jgi:hypothetical protein